MARERNDPVESVELRISIKTDRSTARKIKDVIPSARLKGGSCELKLVGSRPADVSERAEEVMERLREVIGSPKDFKNADGSQGKK